MASTSPTLCLALFIALLFLASPALSTHSPESSPSLPPAKQISPSPATPSAAPSPSPTYSSPPAPPPSDLAPNSPSPTPAPAPQQDDAPHTKSPSPAPAPAPDAVGDNSDEDKPNAGDIEAEVKSSGGMNGGQKAGVAIGVIAGVCLVGAGALVYKKRQQNIQRAQFGSAAREIL